MTDFRSLVGSELSLPLTRTHWGSGKEGGFRAVKGPHGTTQLISISSCFKLRETLLAKLPSTLLETRSLQSPVCLASPVDSHVFIFLMENGRVIRGHLSVSLSCADTLPGGLVLTHWIETRGHGTGESAGRNVVLMQNIGR